MEQRSVGTLVAVVALGYMASFSGLPASFPCSQAPTHLAGAKAKIHEAKFTRVFAVVSGKPGNEANMALAACRELTNVSRR